MPATITRPPTRTERPRMTADDARSFATFSLANAVRAAGELVAAGVCDGSCEPYRDVFTYRRWAAQGFQVQRGQHGVKLPVIVHSDETDEDGKPVGGSHPWTTTVFCRHQVAEK